MIANINNVWSFCVVNMVICQTYECRAGIRFRSPRSLHKRVNQMASCFEAFVAAIYLASVIESATILCSLEHHEIHPTYKSIDIAISRFSCVRITIAMNIRIPLRYLKIDMVAAIDWHIRDIRHSWYSRIRNGPKNIIKTIHFSK